MKQARCRGCGAKILWAKKTDGSGAVPLNPNKTTVFIESEVPGHDGLVFTATGHMSHFVTCPKADRFRKGGGK